MTTGRRQDNSTFARKRGERRLALQLLAARGIAAVVCETHGGHGVLFRACYRTLPGVVFEKDKGRVQHLARQRPTWRVYGAEATTAIAAGAAAELPVTLLDVDPWGNPWPTLRAWFSSDRVRPPLLAVCVNDGMLRKVHVGGIWDVDGFQGMAERFGNKPAKDYLAVCRVLLAEYAGRAGYRVARFAGTHCGANRAMTHYVALCERGPA